MTVTAAPQDSVNGSGPAPFDLDAAVAAARAEANHEPFRFSYAGGEYELAPPKDWPMDIQSRLAAGQVVEGVRAILLGGPEALTRFMGSDPTPTLGVVETLLEQVSAWAGMQNLGNSGPLQRPASTPT